MQNASFEDKVYGCWLGKNIGGTLGGPLEGIMELMDINNYTQEFVGAVENDDLDLQLVALHCVEQYGGLVDTQKLAAEWVSHVHFQFDEYGHALTNMRKGIKPPLSGKYNNFFTDCMGSPIRSELWGIICAGMPDLAAYFAFQDATVDHAGGEGVYGEIFFAVFESLAFECSDINLLIDKSLSYIPKECEVSKAVRCLLSCKENKQTWKEARQMLIDNFGGENFTYAPINIAFTLVGLLYEEGFTARLLTTTNCGYDTDCTCATISSMMGILYGSGYIDEMWTKPLGENILVSRPVNGFNAPKNIKELTERTLKARTLIQAIYETTEDKSIFSIDFDVNKEVTSLPQGSYRCCDLICETRYEDDNPTIAPNQTKIVALTVKNKSLVDYELNVNAMIENDFCIIGGGSCLLKPNESAIFDFNITASNKKSAVYCGNFKLTQLCGKRNWTSYIVPFTLLPTSDWQIILDSKEYTTQFFSTARLELEDLLTDKSQQVTAKTRLYVPQAQMIDLLVICREPIMLYVDKKLCASSDEPTIIIPAYHRADRKKCAELFLEAGYHDIEIQALNASKLKDLFFYAVNKDFYSAGDIDCFFEV